MKILVSALMMVVMVSSLVVPGSARGQAQQFPAIELPLGYKIEKVVDGLTFATGLAWDDQGRLYVAEAGGGFLEEAPPPRILRVEAGRVTEVVNLADKGVRDSMVGLTYHKGSFYVTHRASDFTGAVSRVGMDGTVTQLFSGLTDSRSEHQVNDVRVGPDGRMYVATGPAGNSGVIGLDLAAFVGLNPDLKTTSCRDIVLTGQNFETPDFRTMDVPDVTLTGAYVPFGTATTPGERIQGTRKCGGSILVFDPDNAEATIRPYADGMRNIIGLTWNKQGEMFAAVNGFDVRGSRPVNDEWDATYRVREGAWYGFPDFSAALEPLTDPKFDSPDSLQAPIFVGGQPQGKKLGFLIDHAASGLTPPDKALIAGLHAFGSSPSMLDIAPDSWGDLAGRIFTAEFGDLSPNTNPLRDTLPGYQISYIDPETKIAAPFIRNVKPGPASAQSAAGQALERPFDVKFGPDGAMYISDYGVVRVNPPDAEPGDDPYEFPPRTGTIWKVTRDTSVPFPADTFQAFYRAHGGLPVFGLPLTRERLVNGRVAQYFERQRFEYHPQLAAPYTVSLGRLGVEVLAMKGIDWPSLPTVDAAPAGCAFFAETRHSLCADFLRYWQTHGLEFDGTGGFVPAESLALFGYPISEPRVELNPSGDRVLTQWFERARFEFHPNNAEPFKVLLGRLGAEVR